MLKKMIERQLKGVPEAQRNMIMKAVQENPDFFEKISKEIKVKTKEGVPEQTASFQVMMKYKQDLQKIMTGQ